MHKVEEGTSEQRGAAVVYNTVDVGSYFQDVQTLVATGGEIDAAVFWGQEEGVVCVRVSPWACESGVEEAEGPRGHYQTEAEQHV